jgi:FHS family L-fucose permease-like MFS transporter
VAGQAGIFSFFINYLTWETPSLSTSLSGSWLNRFAAIGSSGAFRITDAGAAALASGAFGLFLFGRFIGASMLKRVSPSRMLGVYALCAAAVCIVVCLKLGWVSAGALFLSYFFMSIMFPTIFALGIHGLGEKAKRASGYIVMAIIGGALVPKLMGAVGDAYGVSISFIVPAACFLAVAVYGFAWKYLSGASEGAQV